MNITYAHMSTFLEDIHPTFAERYYDLNRYRITVSSILKECLGWEEKVVSECTIYFAVKEYSCVLCMRKSVHIHMRAYNSEYSGKETFQESCDVRSICKFISGIMLSFFFLGAGGSNYKGLGFNAASG